MALFSLVGVFGASLRELEVSGRRGGMEKAETFILASFVTLCLIRNKLEEVGYDHLYTILERVVRVVTLWRCHSLNPSSHVCKDGMIHSDVFSYLSRCKSGIGDDLLRCIKVEWDWAGSSARGKILSAQIGDRG